MFYEQKLSYKYSVDYLSKSLFTFSWNHGSISVSLVFLRYWRSQFFGLQDVLATSGGHAMATLTGGTRLLLVFYSRHTSKPHCFDLGSWNRQTDRRTDWRTPFVWWHPLWWRRHNTGQSVGWLWRNFTIPYLSQLFSHRDVGQVLRNVCYCHITFLVR